MNTEVSLTPREQRLAERKNKAVDELSVQFSKNAMPVEEYERLVEYINKAESERELAIIERIVGESAAYAGLDRSPQKERDPSENSSNSRVSANVFGGNMMFDGDFTDITLFSSRGLDGRSLVEKRRSLFTLFGSTVITVKDGELPAGETVVDAVSLFGSVVIHVPKNVSVRMEANAILGDASVRGGRHVVQQVGCPCLVVRGAAFLGEIMVQVGK